MWHDIDRRVQRALAGVRQAFRGVLAQANSQPPVQLVQTDALAGERLQDSELFQHYGFTSTPLPGTMAVVLPVGGKTSHGIVVATEHGSYRLKALRPGEVALYTDEGARIVLRRGRVIETDCDVFRVNCQTWEVNAASQATFTTPSLTASAELVAQGQISGNGGLVIQGGSGAQVTGSLSTSGDVVAGGTSLMHHSHPGDSGGVTGPPL
ncbi:Probable bacteriophage base plate protein [Laribacter hongkongensis HLHK9]|uniref:Probable bacteriophage base plate protein n=1 Tax=Laribacter hongkongensis (strain HLHK9) TaxID=557598 RepID=C1D6N2_LARHH|nr:phage baseplate assembly protein V [Laribacter hongkongensis]ACO74139.1 Probable bacteriophage base plate protein [Laribacter hongkongensis HLHK9]